MKSSEAIARDERFMAEAIELARRATGRTHPNPLVGCVIVRGDRVIGRGYHARAGGFHAEVAALKDAASDVSGCEMYVNHEPCCHFGRTPPCTDAILNSGIRRVVVSTIDPDPRVSGQGIDILRQAGIEVVCNVLEQESRRLNAPFFKYINHGRPWIAAKWAMSLDGKIATRSADSTWITGDQARSRGHGLRNTHDAILVGKGTLLADNPRLTCRIDGGRDPVRFVVDARLEAPLDHRIFNLEESEAATIVLTAADPDSDRRRRFEDQGVKTITVDCDERGWLAPAGIVAAIYDRRLMSVLVEGGGALLGSLFDAELIDYAYAFIAPQLIGGAAAPSPVEGRGIEAIADCLHLQSPNVEELAPDLLVHGPVGTAPNQDDTGREA